MGREGSVASRVGGGRQAAIVQYDAAPRYSTVNYVNVLTPENLSDTDSDTRDPVWQ